MSWRPCKTLCSSQTTKRSSQVMTFSCLQCTFFILCQSTAHCSSLSARRAAESSGGEEKWIKFEDGRAREICYKPPTKWVCLMCIIFHCLPVNWLSTEFRQHAQVSEGRANTSCSCGCCCWPDGGFCVLCDVTTSQIPKEFKEKTLHQCQIVIQNVVCVFF